MATSYKTPGVYIEEISKFPPSVTQVETAIPAFIGYTEKATKTVADDLLLVPTRISSQVEYESYFGKALDETSISINVDDNYENGITTRTIVANPPSSKSPFLMYYAMQMYFANGGGPCYIISVCNYEDASLTVDFDELNEGLNKLELEDEPTLIVFPDATALNEADYYALMNNALTQCNKLQDRFAIIDTYDETEDSIEEIRNGINLEKDYLKYGAVYYPFLETILNFQYDAKAVKINHTSTVPTAIATAFTQIEEYEDDFGEVADELRDITSADNGYIGMARKKITDELSDFTSTGPALATLKTSAGDLINLSEDIIETLSEADTIRLLITDAAESAAESVEEDLGDYDSNPATPDTNPTSDVITSAIDSLTTLFEGTGKIEDVIENLELAVENLKIANSKTKIQTNVETISAELDNLFVFATPTPTTDVLTNAISTISTVKAAVQAADSSDLNNGPLNGRNLASIESIDNDAYNKIKTKINNLPITLPPSAAMAGVYARVDKDRGVWKAPANVGLNYVTKPSVKITHEMQEGLNVDSTAGKSINAIRAFTGKGTLVWGARTLAGNDNEWRYIPVRRFFNMVEESVKKATSQYVFEPNDANTWIKVRAMIENFLTLQWRAGALAGAKQDEAFYVRVGLGQTMTAQDILNGYMHVEIGMAVVRPAEFIILKFSHKLQES
ncbi:MAG TPA: phage tail sheath C-terminal domain-containing protein [Prolixibacteraceae bacterium]|nr:phage tail sheath C-terminal domain-containing protein [Prolixibacteraceae bacterium]